MWRIQCKQGDVIKWYRSPNQLTDLDIMAKPYPNQGIANTGIKLIQKDFPDLVKGMILEAKEWEE